MRARMVRFSGLRLFRGHDLESVLPERQRDRVVAGDARHFQRVVSGAPDRRLEWGWRVPFLFGILIGPIGLYIRRRLDETPEYVEIKPTRTPVRDVVREHPVEVLLAMGAAVVSNSSAYIILYIPTYAMKELHLPQATGFTATFVGAVILGIVSPFAGHLSDKFGRSGILTGMAWLFFLTTYPVFYLMVAS